MGLDARALGTPNGEAIQSGLRDVMHEPAITSSAGEKWARIGGREKRCRSEAPRPWWAVVGFGWQGEKARCVEKVADSMDSRSDSLPHACDG
ncbi:hypothetical protein E2562_034712 [Oryza meyeriana var. granulata]|uniref:Uncharacterized protein n=1 Tax=Oryza meyeriana var. granulata TaxID=110450 RepID=A0A6G1CC81_9ORYZ|nr:hypothetical protein E2562_034712 [Oryza meyeriana var. granulata]